MTSPGSDAFYSPVPQDVPLPAGPPPPYAVQPWVSPSGRPTVPPAPQLPIPTHPGPATSSYAPQPAPPRTTSPRKRRRWIAALAAALVFVVGGATAITLYATRGTKLVTDGPHRISLRVPNSWTDYTDPDPDSSAPDSEDEVPDLDVESVSGSQYVYAYVDPSDGADLVQAQADAVAGLCDDWPCRDRGSAQPVIVDGQRGLEQVLTHEADDGGVSVVLTVQSARWLVTATGERQAVLSDTVDPEPVRRILRTLTVTP